MKYTLSAPPRPYYEPPPYRRESASEIAWRIRNCVPPRPLFISEAHGNGETISSIGRTG